MHVFGASGFGVSYPSSGLESFWFAIWRYVDMIHVKNEDLIDDTYFPTYFTFFMFFLFSSLFCRHSVLEFGPSILCYHHLRCFFLRFHQRTRAFSGQAPWKYRYLFLFTNDTFKIGRKELMTWTTCGGYGR